MEENKLPFIETIYHLRTIEQLILYTKVLKVSLQEEKEVVAFLQDEYDKERLNYPFVAPKFDEQAALWGAKIIYFSSQLLLNREDTEKDLQVLLPNFKGDINPSSILSADLCLRFLPQVLLQMKRLDSEDKANAILERFLLTFHYSNIGYDNHLDNYQWNTYQCACYQQLYLNRVWERKDKLLAQIPEINHLLHANFGNYKNWFWKALESNEKHQL